MDNHILNYSLYIFFGILPSFIWLQFYLRRDVKPEPKLMILKIFFYGMLLTIPAIFIEMAFYEQVSALNLPETLSFFLNLFIGVALIEEFLKFLVVKLKVLDDPEYDEPVDSMIYMIIAALGFAAAENLLVLVSVGSQYSRPGELLLPIIGTSLWGEIVEISVLRFLGATFLHALASATVGFFMGLSFFNKKRRGKLIFVGLVLAVVLHGLYNFSIMKVENQMDIFIPFSLLFLVAVLISFGFKKLKELKGF
jgi:RsiW-degrading membrane proteinase PrsW (M82 family)